MTRCCRIVYVCVLCIISALGSEVPGPLRSGGLEITMKSKGLGGYTVSLDNETWLFGGGYSLLNMSLRAVGGAVPSSGSDRFGEYNSITVRWANSTSKDLEPVWETQFRTYTEGWRGGGLAIFRQTFLCEFDPPSLGTEANQHAVLGGFPSFDTSQTNPNKPLNVLNYIGSQLQYSGFTRWGAGSRYRASADHGFPAVLYDKSRRSLVVSPFSSFHVGILSTLTDPSGLRLDAGLKSTLLNVPANYEFETVLVSGRGVNATMAAFGDALLSASGKERANPDDDFILSNLGYWTDNGTLKALIFSSPSFNRVSYCPFYPTPPPPPPKNRCLLLPLS